MAESTSRGGKGKDNQVACKEMGYFCFNVLENHLKNISPPGKPCFTNDAYPLFVTWKTIDDDLKGCIGTFEATPLHRGLKEYAIRSATKDSRFDPISLGEFKNLSVGVSILTQFEKASHHLDWEVGVHGIIIEFEDDRGRKLSATYLPEVASEHGWTQTQAIDHLIRKAGFNRPVTSEIREAISLTRYQSEKIKVDYNDYDAWKQAR